ETSRSCIGRSSPGFRRNFTSLTTSWPSSRREAEMFKSFTPQIKAVGSAGTVTFVVATLNVIDSDGDVTVPGAFGRQNVPMIPAHDWSSVPIGKGLLFEQGSEAIVDAQLNLAVAEARSWFDAIKFDVEHPPPLQEYSYGYSIRPGG